MYFYLICAMIYCSFCCIYVWLDPGTYMIARFMFFYKPGVTVSISSFTVIQGPHSWSPPLYRLVLWNRVLEPLLIRFIYICNIRLHVYIFLLVFFDSLVGKAFSARSIKLCLVDNQQSTGVTVAWLRIMLIRSRIANVTYSTNRIYLYLSEDQA